MTEVERLRAVLDQLANELEGTQYGNVAELLTEVKWLRKEQGGTQMHGDFAEGQRTLPADEREGSFGDVEEKE